jgi:hypothetical protein
MVDTKCGFFFGKLVVKITCSGRGRYISESIKFVSFASLDIAKRIGLSYM